MAKKVPPAKTPAKPKGKPMMGMPAKKPTMPMKPMSHPGKGM